MALLYDIKTLVNRALDRSPPYFHHTSVLSALKILDSNTLSGGVKGFVSLSDEQDPSKRQTLLYGGKEVALVFDRIKINNHYNPIPWVEYRSGDDPIHDDEVVIKMSEVDNIERYLLGVILYHNRLDKDSRYLSSLKEYLGVKKALRDQIAKGFQERGQDVVLDPTIPEVR